MFFTNLGMLGMNVGLDVRVIDHIIVAANGSSLTSMAERGLL